MLIIDFPKLVSFITNIFNAIAKIVSALKTVVDALNTTGIVVRLD